MHTSAVGLTFYTGCVLAGRNDALLQQHPLDLRRHRSCAVATSMAIGSGWGDTNVLFVMAQCNQAQLGHAGDISCRAHMLQHMPTRSDTDKLCGVVQHMPASFCYQGSETLLAGPTQQLSEPDCRRPTALPSAARHANTNNPYTGGSQRPHFQIQTSSVELSVIAPRRPVTLHIAAVSL